MESTLHIWVHLAGGCSQIRSTLIWTKMMHFGRCLFLLMDCRFADDLNGLLDYIVRELSVFACEL